MKRCEDREGERKDEKKKNEKGGERQMRAA